MALSLTELYAFHLRAKGRGVAPAGRLRWLKRWMSLH